MQRGVTLRTERLALRALSADDAGWIARAIADPRVQVMLPTVPHPFHESDAVSWLRARSRWRGNYAITEAGDPLGVVTLALAGGAPELGFWLARHAWGRGIMTEAAGAALAGYFRAGGRPIPSGHIIDNRASRRVLTKLGFRDVGLIFRRSAFRGHDVVIRRMALTRTSWEARHGH